MKKHQLPKIGYLENHLEWLNGAMAYLDGYDDRNNELERYELEHAVWLLKKVETLNVENISELIQALETELNT